MKIGVVYPQREISRAPTELRQFALEIEHAGFAHMVMYDHVLGVSHADRDPPLGGPYDENDPFHDPFVSFGYLAAATTRLEFFTGVLVLPQRQTALVARQAADVDLLSAGRLNLGVGVGWNAVEYRALGQPFHLRGKRLDEQIPLLRKLWSGELVGWKGEFDTIDRAALCPAPSRQIPIYCGGFAPAAFRRAARIADGFIFGGQRISGLVEQWKQVQAMLAENGRPINDFGAQALILDETFSGLSVGEAVDALNIWRDAGGTHASIVTTGRRLSSSEDHIDYLLQIIQRAS
ncbi:LLM class F420-dependent oxidoreductase [Sphingobium lactosutens]|uniref:LLM class F420-dependent oxidoreductase n=1 Tax=Sphingobium lactosutens TaxID=522773 RepID=UPI0015B9E23D|nr:LLM class F420-dependent oxidoreductase [Sphingobium lactosutens]NWK97391.1 LLM class F420-dependent oxidoreductase [Sphingobium lactosutens]